VVQQGALLQSAPLPEVRRGTARLMMSPTNRMALPSSMNEGKAAPGPGKLDGGWTSLNNYGVIQDWLLF
jgi:hypothetical protein